MKVTTLLFFSFFSASVLCAQGVKIAPASGAPDPSAGLDVDFNNKGVLFPRVTSSQRLSISSPANGLLVYQTDAPTGLWYNAGTPSSPNWVHLVQNPANDTLDMSNNSIVNVPPPVNNNDAVNKAYVDAIAASGGGTPGGIPTMLSNESAVAYTQADATNYCDSLTEGGHSDWRMPTFDELTYFNGRTASQEFLWTKTMAEGKENPLNQNYVSVRLSDGKWRLGGEVTSLFIEKTVSGSSTNPPSTTWGTIATYTAANPVNVFTPVSIYYNTGYSIIGDGSTTKYCNVRHRLKYNYADGTATYSEVYLYSASRSLSSSSSNNVTRFDRTFPMNAAITPLSSIEIQAELDTANPVAPTCIASATVTISGYETSMNQQDGKAQKVRCVR